MFPWFWLWSPQVHFPWSGSVSQDIHPETNWFSENIKGKSGNADIERTAFAIASYGRQLGLIIDVLIAQTEENSNLQNPEAKEALRKLKDIKTAIDAVKIVQQKKADT
jgi:hypothetical protein